MNILNTDMFIKIVQILQKDNQHTIIDYECENNILLKSNIILKIKLHYSELFGRNIIFNVLYLDLSHWLNEYEDLDKLITIKFKNILDRSHILIDDFINKNIDLKSTCYAILDSLSIIELNDFYHIISQF